MSLRQFSYVFQLCKKKMSKHHMLVMNIYEICDNDEFLSVFKSKCIYIYINHLDGAAKATTFSLIVLKETWNCLVSLTYLRHASSFMPLRATNGWTKYGFYPTSQEVVIIIWVKRTFFGNCGVKIIKVHDRGVTSAFVSLQRLPSVVDPTFMASQAFDHVFMTRVRECVQCAPSCHFP